MKVFFINPFFPPWAPGGAEHSLEQMCVQFSKYGWKVDVLATAFDKRDLDEERAGYCIRWTQAPFQVKPGQDLTVEADNYYRSEHYLNSVTDRFAELDKPDIVIANNAQAYEIVTRIGEKYQLPTIAIVRDTQALCEFGACMDNFSADRAVLCTGNLGAVLCSVKFQRARGEKGWRPLPAWAWYGIQMHRRRLRLRSALQKFDHIVTISDALNLLLRRGLPMLKSARVTTISNFSTEVETIDASEVDQFLGQKKLTPGRFFIFAGRKTYGKGADLLVSATKLIGESNPDVSSLLLGRGKLSGDIGKKCVDEGSVSRSLLLGLLQQATALVIPGRWQEGLHRTMIDAIKFGIPVICTRPGAPSIDGVVHGENGLVCRSSDPKALAKAMVDVLHWDKQQLDNCRSESSRIFQQRFADSLIMAKWSNLIMSIASARKNKFVS